MSFERSFDGWEPARPAPIGRLSGTQEEHRVGRTWVMATGTLACPRCDAPVAPARPLSPRDPLGCPYCAHAGAVRDFLSLAAPARPARVEIHVSVARGPAPRSSRSPRAASA